MKPSDFLKELGLRFGVDLVFDDEGICSIIFDKNDVIDFMFRDNRFCLMGEIGTMVDDVVLLKEIIVSNSKGEDFDGSFITGDEHQNSLVLYKLLPEEADFETYEAHLVSFIRKLRRWKLKLDENNLAGHSDGGLPNQDKDVDDISLMLTSIRV